MNHCTIKTLCPPDDKEVAADGYLKMTSSDEVDDQAVAKGNVDDTGSHSGNSETTIANEYMCKQQMMLKIMQFSVEDYDYENDQKQLANR